MPLALNLIEELFVVAAPSAVRPVVCDLRRWALWLPGARLSPYDDRGALGVRWTVAGTLTGTAEVWLEEHGDGTIVHAYLRADPVPARGRNRPLSRRQLADRYELAMKRGLFEVKALVEGDREPGSARVPVGERVVSASDSGRVARRHPPPRAGPRTEGEAADG